MYSAKHKRYYLNLFLNHSKFSAEKYNYSYNRSETINSLSQVYDDDDCNSNVPDRNLVQDDSFWTMSIPHPQFSGICYTYKYDN